MLIAFMIGDERGSSLRKTTASSLMHALLVDILSDITLLSAPRIRLMRQCIASAACATSASTLESHR